MTMDDGTAAPRARWPRSWWIAGVLVVAGCVVAALVLAFRGDDGARRAAEAVADAMTDDDDGAYEAVVCAVEKPSLGPVAPMPEVMGESEVIGVSGSEGEDGEDSARATLDTTWQREFYVVFLTESDDGWCPEGIASCSPDEKRSAFTLPCPHRSEE
jgi:hypothetical protein